MKKFLLIAFCALACTFSIQAQVLYGTTLTGGEHGAGTINKLIVETNKFLTVYSPEGIDGRNPQKTSFVQATDGKLYGMTASGGAYKVGVIFSYDPASDTYTKLKDFDGVNGGTPYGSLMQANDGKLYGMTSAGGNKGGGVIFSFDPATLIYKKLRDFDSTTGFKPEGDLIQANDGKLYGMTPLGGEFHNSGVVFSFDPSTSTYSVLKTFTGVDGASPKGSLLQSDNGKLYGMTSTTYEALPFGDGCIFSLDPGNAEYEVVYNFDSGAGKNPAGSLIQASDGKLYGRALSDDLGGQDFIFSFEPTSSDFKVVQENVGYSPGKLLEASDGTLYGMAYFTLGTTYSAIFSFEPSTSFYKIVHYFNYYDNSIASKPLGSLIQARDGKLYGMNSDGGSTFYNNGILQGAGTLFSFALDTSGYTKLKDFGDNGTGSNMTGSLLLATDGKFYGMTLSGGDNGGGILFSYDSLTYTYTKLKDLSDTDGVYPYGSLIQASNGKLYGLTSAGRGWGAIVSYDPVAAVYKVLKSFGKWDGSTPYGSLVEAGNAKLYGMTKEGGNSNVGVIFSYDPRINLFAKIKDLTTETGTYPYGSLVAASDGKLYGMTSSGGSHGYGTIFSLDPLTSVFTKLKDFDSTNGSHPFGSLIQASDGKLYGTTQFGTNSAPGAIFSYDPVSGTYTWLADFNGTNCGSFPTGTLFQASNGKIYGMTSEGGAHNLGAVFCFDMHTDKILKVKDLDGANGAKPSFQSGFMEVPECSTSIAYYRDADGDGYGNPYNWKVARSKPDGYVTNNEDCDDFKAALHPITYYRDADGDGYGDPNESMIVCSLVPPAGYVSNDKDDDDQSKLGYKISNYPNPFKETSSIKYSIPFDSKVSITVYDLSGKPVAKLVNENKKAGFYTVKFNAGGFNGGILYYRISATSKDQRFEQTNKMVLLR